MDGAHVVHATAPVRRALARARGTARLACHRATEHPTPTGLVAWASAEQAASASRPAQTAFSSKTPTGCASGALAPAQRAAVLAQLPVRAAAGSRHISGGEAATRRAREAHTMMLASAGLVMRAAWSVMHRAAVWHAPRMDLTRISLAVSAHAARATTRRRMRASRSTSALARMTASTQRAASIQQVHIFAFAPQASLAMVETAVTLTSAPSLRVPPPRATRELPARIRSDLSTAPAQRKDTPVMVLCALTPTNAHWGRTGATSTLTASTVKRAMPACANVAFFPFRTNVSYAMAASAATTSTSVPLGWITATETERRATISPAAFSATAWKCIREMGSSVCLGLRPCRRRHPACHRLSRRHRALQCHRHRRARGR